MERKLTEVQKFGGAQKLGDVSLHGYEHEVDHIEAQSKTNLEQDTGNGAAAVIRCFEFKANKEAFEANPPSRQDLLTAHAKGIELSLWKDGLKVLPSVEPRLVFDEKTLKYQIFVGAIPSRGHILQEMPNTLKELVHG